MDRRTFLVAAPLALAGCSYTAKWASDDHVAANIYRHDGPPALTLYTVRNVGTDNGAHTAMMINANQRILWDPAGSFGHDSIPERNDVIYGATPRIEQFFISYHSRRTYYTQIQHLEVSAEIAEMALRKVIDNGPTPRSFCTTDTSRMLRSLPGFEGIRVTFFPNNLADQFGRYPGVRERLYQEDSDPSLSVAAANLDAAIRAGQ